MYYIIRQHNTKIAATVAKFGNRKSAAHTHVLRRVTAHWYHTHAHHGDSSHHQRGRLQTTL